MKNPIILYRFARFLHVRRVPFAPRMITLFIRLVYGCYLPHTALIGKGCSLGYGGLGVVIGGDARIGDNVEIGSSVLIGGNARAKGKPVVESGVYIGAGAKVLGPIIIGRNSVIAANSVVLESVPPNSVVAGMPARVVKEGIEINEFLYHRRLYS